MFWNWELPGWPHLIYESTLIASMEKKILQEAGGIFAILTHLDNE
ncbi:DUF4172 domain-containing protein [Chlamydiales bacterium]|nr:DUF4172 domain-containing protein [Chlamydiales bacterium]